MRASMLEDFRKKVLSLWPLEDLSGLGEAPTSYIDEVHAFAFLPFGVTRAAPAEGRGQLMSGLVIPMLWEDGAWKVDMPGWRFLETDGSWRGAMPTIVCCSGASAGQGSP